MALLPWARRARALAEAATTTAAPVSAPAAQRPRAEWRDLAAMPTAVPQHLRGVVAPDRFRADLGSTWSTPPVLQPLAHAVTADAPAGLVAGHVVPVPAAGPVAGPVVPVAGRAVPVEGYAGAALRFAAPMPEPSAEPAPQPTGLLDRLLRRSAPAPAAAPSPVAAPAPPAPTGPIAAPVARALDRPVGRAPVTTHPPAVRAPEPDPSTYPEPGRPVLPTSRSEQAVPVSADLPAAALAPIKAVRPGHPEPGAPAAATRAEPAEASAPAGGSLPALPPPPNLVSPLLAADRSPASPATADYRLPAPDAPAYRVPELPAQARAATAGLVRDPASPRAQVRRPVVTAAPAPPAPPGRTTVGARPLGQELLASVAGSVLPGPVAALVPAVLARVGTPAGPSAAGPGPARPSLPASFAAPSARAPAVHQYAVPERADGPGPAEPPAGLPAWWPSQTGSWSVADVDPFGHPADPAAADGPWAAAPVAADHLPGGADPAAWPATPVPPGGGGNGVPADGRTLVAPAPDPSVLPPGEAPLLLRRGRLGAGPAGRRVAWPAGTDPTDPDPTSPAPTGPAPTGPVPTSPDMTDPAPTSPDLTQPDLTQPDLTQPDLTSPAPDRDRPTYDAAARQDAGRFRPDDLAARPGDDTSSVARDRQLTAPVAPAELPALRRVQRPGSEDGNAGMDVESWRHGLDLAAEQAASPHHAAAESMPLPPPMPLPVPTPFAADVAAPPPAAPSAAAGGPPHRAAPTAEEVSAHLRHELLLDRERAGSLADLW